MGRSTEYYRTHPEARKKKAETDKKINARPEQKAKRRELGRKNYKTDKLKGKAYRKGKDLCHTAKGLRNQDQLTEDLNPIRLAIETHEDER